MNALSTSSNWRGQPTGPVTTSQQRNWSPMISQWARRMPSTISIGQPSSSSVSEFRVLPGPHPGTPTLVSIFFLVVLAIHTLSQKHIPGVQNSATDALSWDRASALQCLHANPTPSPIPSTLQDLLLALDACWTSPHWPKASPTTPRAHTTLGNDVSSGSAK